MLTVKVNDNLFEVCESWKDITIAKAVELYKIKLPEKLKDIYNLTYYSRLPEKEKEVTLKELQAKITDEDNHKHFPRFYASALEILSNIPHDIIMKTDVISVKALYFEYLQKFVEGIFFFPQYEFKPITSFEFKGETYCLPMSREVFGTEVPMADITAMEFIESADMLSAATSLQKDLSKLATLVAIICRPKGEKYDEKTAIKRTGEFQELTMDVVWNVFFSLAVPLITWHQLEAMSSLRKVGEGN